MNNIQAVAYFDDTKPNEAEIRRMLEDEQKFCTDPVSSEDVEAAIQKAEKWLHWAAQEINRGFNFSAVNGQDVSVKVMYAEGEDLGWTCKNAGQYPFNNVYPEGPTIHVEILGKVSIKPKSISSGIRLDYFTITSSDGYLLIVRLPKWGMFVAFRNK